VSCGFTILCGVISIVLLLGGPAEKLSDHVGELAAQPFGVRAVTVVDVAGVLAAATAFPVVIIPPNRLVTAGLVAASSVIKGFSR
jgi:hypothetical protein